MLAAGLESGTHRGERGHSLWEDEAVGGLGKPAWSGPLFAGDAAFPCLFPGALVQVSESSEHPAGISNKCTCSQFDSSTLSLDEE